MSHQVVEVGAAQRVATGEDNPRPGGAQGCEVVEHRSELVGGELSRISRWHRLGPAVLAS
jgi:hypothetical protein